MRRLAEHMPRPDVDLVEGVPPTLARTLRSTNSIESMIEICRDHAGNVKRWQDGQMVLRWIESGARREAPAGVPCGAWRRQRHS